MIYLASQSPRRQELLQQIAVPFTVIQASIDETPQPNEVPLELVKRLAVSKACAGLEMVNAQSLEEHPVLGSDTIVVCDAVGNEAALASDLILGKPVNEADFLTMFRQLSGSAHRVITAVALVDNQRQHVVTSESRVHFRSITEAEMRAYWQTGEPHDKAGGYGIQGQGAVFVRHLEGSYSGVMGLPLYETAQLLARFDVPVMG